jgi:hypothetical protein
LAAAENPDQALTPALSLSTGRGGNTLRDFFAVALPPFLLLALSTSGCYLAAGDGLGLYLGGIALGMLLTPPLALAYDTRLNRILAAASIADGVGVIWLIAMLRSDVTFGQWLAAYVLLAACVIGVAGIASALARYVVRDLFASAVTVAFALAWLTWPIWLSAWVDYARVARVMEWLIPGQPLLAMNGLLSSLGVWGESPLMYQLTSLGQDVPYSLPSVAPCAIAHFLLGGALLLLSRPRAAVDVPDRHRR